MSKQKPQNGGSLVNPPSSTPNPYPIPDRDQRITSLLVSLIAPLGLSASDPSIVEILTELVNNHTVCTPDMDVTFPCHTTPAFPTLTSHHTDSFKTEEDAIDFFISYQTLRALRHLGDNWPRFASALKLTTDTSLIRLRLKALVYSAASSSARTDAADWLQEVKEKVLKNKPPGLTPPRIPT